MAHRVTVLVVTSALLFGCGGALGSAERDYKKGHIPEAKAKLESLEGESTSWSTKKQATYALYRGLTLLSVGDRARAAEWLAKAHEWEASNPGLLTQDDRSRLRLAESSLQERGGSTP